MFLNVCINARDALMSAECESPKIRLQFEHVSEGFVRVTISDNGPGMRSEVRARNFEPFFRIILEQAGFGVVEAQDGSAGLEALERLGQTIDLVVLDRSMPRMSGEQSLMELRRRQLRVPVVLLTGQLGSDAAGDGVAAVVLEPPASGELVRTIRVVLDRARVLTCS